MYPGFCPSECITMEIVGSKWLLPGNLTSEMCFPSNLTQNPSLCSVGATLYVQTDSVVVFLIVHTNTVDPIPTLSIVPETLAFVWSSTVAEQMAM